VTRRLEIVPAIDLRGGACVRLLHGDPSRETRYDDDPVARAQAFVAAGARRLHVVDLDGAFGTGENIEALRAICAAVDVPVQTGGGIRSEPDARGRFAAGAQWIVLSTMLVENPTLARALIATYGERIIGGVDARGDVVAYRGWQVETGLRRDAFVRELATWGVERIVYTEISRDGAGTGYDVAALAAVAGLAPLRITASGGANGLDDLRALLEGTPLNVDAAIVGRALYAGTIDLAEALAAFA
jgi:phosphoribosylformimino-5-aminoimidazole carboxamide ribotide isomerase